MICPHCDATVPDQDLFCENCGSKLAVAEAEPTAANSLRCPCSEDPAEFDEEGYCLACGRRSRRSSGDRVEETISPRFAAVSDRGLHHSTNQDCFALAHEEGSYIMAVCDGVSSTRAAEMASSLAAQEIVAALLGELKSAGSVAGEPAMQGAFASASSSLAARGDTFDADDAPSTTAVAALVAAGSLTVGWVGDSRAYWIDPTGARQLTRDHSWVQEVVAAGELSQAEAQASPQAHAITRWLGPDAGAAAPESVQMQVQAGGMLLLCSDGLWNYLQDEAVLARLVAEAGEDAYIVASHLVDFAVAQGGVDNITVAVLCVDSATDPEELSAPSEQSSSIARTANEEAAHAESVQG